jgi:uncharacterized membrane protein
MEVRQDNTMAPPVEQASDSQAANGDTARTIGAAAIDSELDRERNRLYFIYLLQASLIVTSFLGLTLITIFICIGLFAWVNAAGSTGSALVTSHRRYLSRTLLVIAAIFAGKWIFDALIWTALLATLHQGASGFSMMTLVRIATNIIAGVGISFLVTAWLVYRGVKGFTRLQAGQIIA